MEILTQLQTQFNEWLPWAAGAAGLTALLSWLPGGGAIVIVLTSALRFLASFFEMISPLINALFGGVIWLWKTVFLPGLLDILDSWVTIVTVLTMGAIMWFTFVSRYELQASGGNKELAVCQKSLSQCKAVSTTKERPAEADTPFPWIFWR